MKFTEVLDREEKRRSPEVIAQEKRARVARAKARRAALEVLWTSIELTPEDEALAAILHVPEDDEARGKMASGLRWAGDRKRTYREIAKIMRLHPSVARRLVVGSNRKRPGAVSGHKPPTRQWELAPPERPLHEELRRRRGRRLTQVKLAEALGVEVELVRAWEAGTERPTPAQYAQFVQVLP